ncbi:MAG: hypothetical protein KBD78_10280 [Oligoflexales bacterium]|nr:hypothetical protein [Oligoflexales bacterium]
MLNARNAQIYLWGLLIYCGIFCGGASLAQQNIKAAAKKNKMRNESFRAQMLGLSSSLAELVPYAFSNNMQNWEKNQEKIKQEIIKLKSFAHNVDSIKTMQVDDPALTFVARKLIDDLELSIVLLNKNLHIAAKNNLRTVTEYCIACHSQKPSKSYQAPYIEPINFEKFSTLDKANYLAATRQFIEAKKQYEYLLVDKNYAKNKPDEWANAMKKLLAIVVRIEERPGLAMEFISRVRDVDTIPAEFKQATLVWRNSAKQWREHHDDKSIKTRQQKFNKVRDILVASKVIVSQNKNILDADLIERLRASKYLHEILSDRPRDAIFGESLYLAGVVNESLQEISFSTLHYAYYEACIRFQPYTEMARKCFAAYGKSHAADFLDKKNAVHSQLRDLESLTTQKLQDNKVK